MTRRTKLLILVFLVIFLFCSLITTVVLLMRAQLQVTSLSNQLKQYQTQESDAETEVQIDATTAPTATTPAGKIINLYLSKNPTSYTDPTFVVEVERRPGSANPYQFALNELLKGPNTIEQTSGLFLPFSLTGESNCGGADYTLEQNAETINIKFCKTLHEKLPNDGGFDNIEVNAKTRVLIVLTKSFYINGNEKISIRDLNGNCYARDADPTSTLNVCK